jgi:glutamate N-acetyltransferase/amino-acid N-acetyltransferase
VDAVSVTEPLGFTAAGLAAGIKPNGVHDLTVVAADSVAVAAAMFTVNRFPAAPVRISKQHMAAGPTARAIVINSGSANAGTGPEGLDNATTMAGRVAESLGCDRSDVLVCSTGTIGTPLPMEAIVSGIDAAITGLDRGETADTNAARGIMTTDSVPKQTSAGGAGFKVGGIAKGREWSDPTWRRCSLCSPPMPSRMPTHSSVRSGMRSIVRSMSSTSTVALRRTTPCSYWPQGSPG